MALNKTGGSLKDIFDPVKKAAAAAQMESPAVPARSEPSPDMAREPALDGEPTERAEARTGAGARNRKAGGRNVRISGYIPPELEAALRDEVIRRTLAKRKTVSMNDVLCDALTFWQQHGRARP